MLKDVYLEELDSTNYTAVFVVPTPAIGHSGISHLAEHLCFRGSHQYPASHELFVFNTLSPASINASTESGHTYFYVSTDDLTIFKLALDYLFSGLTERDYCDETITTERDGVIVNELQMYESNEAYRLAVAMRRGDCSENAYQHAGGFSDTIGNIQPTDVLAYKEYWYHPSNTQLLISGPNLTALERAIEKLNTIELALPSNSLTQVDNLKTTDDTPKSKSNLRVYSWWVAEPYLHDILHHEEKIATFVSPFGQLIIDDEINTARLFAIRLLSDRVLETFQTTFINFILNLSVSAKHKVQTATKHPAEVDRLIRLFNHRNRPHGTAIKPLAFYLSNMVTSTLNNIRHIAKVTEEYDFQNNESKIASQLQDKLSLANIPPLPHLFSTMVNTMDINLSFCHEGLHWLYALEGLNEQKLMSIICSAAFWHPRTSGECYAMGVGNYQGKLFVYGAQDRKVLERQDYWQRTLI